MAESADLPAHDPSGAGIDHKGGADEPGPSMDVDKVDHPQRAGRSTRYRRLTLSSGHGALLIVVIVFFFASYAGQPHRGLSRSKVHLATLTPSPQLMPDIADDIEARAGVMAPPDQFSDLVVSLTRTGRLPGSARRAACS